MRLPRRLSASSAQRWINCPTSMALPWVGGEAGEPAARGTAIHAFLDDWSKLGRDEALARVPEVYRDFAESIAEAEVEPGRYIREMLLGYNPRTGEAASYSEDDPEERERWPFTGRADAIAISGDGKEALVIDDKTGRGYVPAARDNWQGRVLAVLVRAVYGVERVEFRLRFHREDGEVAVSRATWGVLDIDLFEEAMVRAAGQYALALAALAQADVVQGEHCRYCPAFAGCPAKTGLVRALVADPAPFEAEIRALATPENIGIAHAKLKTLEQVFGAVRESLAAVAKEIGGGWTPDGRFYGPVEVRKRVLDGPKTVGILNNSFGPEVAGVASKVSVTQESLKNALRIALAAIRAQGGHDTLSGMTERVLAQLEAEGALSYETSTQVREHAGKGVALPEV